MYQGDNEKLGASINFINNSQTMRHEWKLNCFYSFGKGIVNLDGHLTNPFAWEIVSMSIVNGIAKISGPTVLICSGLTRARFTGKYSIIKYHFWNNLSGTMRIL